MIATASDLGVVLSGCGLFAIAVSALAEHRLRDTRAAHEARRQAHIRRVVNRLDES